MQPTTATDRPYVVMDFDSTFTQVEGLEELAEISLRGRADAAARFAKIVELTEGAMSGSYSFAQALKERIALLDAKKEHLDELVAVLKGKVSKSVARNARFFAEWADHVLIVSSGFREFIVPVVEGFGIRAENVHANTFRFDAEGRIIGYDEANELAQDGGKVALMQRLDLPGPVYVIGDGYTDYEIRHAGLADKFYAFAENIRRERVVRRADAVVPTLDEFLYQNKMPMVTSYPKSRIHVLMLENIHPAAHALFEKEGYTLEVVSAGLEEDQLLEKIAGVSILCIRSKTQVTARVLEAAPKLLAIGAFCIGTNQIDLKTCQRRGIAVFNAPYSNTRSVVELAIGEMISLMRRVPAKSAKMHKGIWDKSAAGAVEVRGKTLGLVGYGNIGTQLSVLAEALGMRVLFYDVVDKLALGNARRAETLEELLREADVVSLHVDGRRENHHLIGSEEFGMMKPGVVFLNLARGHVVDMAALAEALRSGHVAGAGLDVYPYEPASNAEPFESELRGMDNVILTPHIGGSTEEAQESIGRYVPGKLIEYVNTGSTFASVNFPNIQLPQLTSAHRLIHVHENTPGVLARINSELAAHGINIVGQYLKTNESIGYVITDVETDYDASIFKTLKTIPGTIKFRVLY